MQSLPVLNTTTRRGFLAACAGCAAASLCGKTADPLTAGELIPDVKPRVSLIFTHLPPEKPTWPNQGFDYEARKKELTAKLTAACPGIEFLPSTAHTAAEAKNIVARDEVDGFVNYMIGIWVGTTDILASTGRPVLLVDDLYGGSGEFLIQYAAARRKGLRVAGVSSSRFEDVVQAVKAFETLKKLQSSIILDVTDRDPGANARGIEESFGTKVVRAGAAEMEQAFQKADRQLGVEMAAKWIKGAKKVVEPSRAEIEKSGVMYAAMQDLMRQHKAQAIAIDCLNLFYAGKLAAYPCLGLCQFNNDGLVGACEADLQSTITMLAMTYLTGRPGYISDPVIDTSKNQIIYAHCVAPTKVYGPNGPTNPYHIRDHSEDRKGAAIRSLLPLGEITTTLKFHPVRKEMVLHQARTVANLDEDKACRTKLAAEVKDVDKLLGEWDRWGWHRVTFYGDLKRPAETLSALLGFAVVHEG